MTAKNAKKLVVWAVVDIPSRPEASGKNKIAFRAGKQYVFGVVEKSLVTLPETRDDGH